MFQPCCLQDISVGSPAPEMQGGRKLLRREDLTPLAGSLLLDDIIYIYIHTLYIYIYIGAAQFD